MRNSKQAAPTFIRHRRYGTVTRLIRTVGVRRPGGTDLYWVIRDQNPDGTEQKGTGMLSVDAWATGDWEVVK